jgi:glutamate carboxypeptidase
MPTAAHETEILSWLDQQQAPMLELLGALVDTDSGSFDQEGVARAAEVIERHLMARGLPCELVAQGDGSVSIRSTLPPCEPAASNAHVLLLGHRDTVFPKGTAAKRPFRVENGRAYGPGVADMKAGLVMNAFLGLAIGLVGAFVLTRAMSTMLVGISPTDVLTYAAMTVLFTVIALIACWVPASRAAALEPTNALRAE